MSRWRCGICKFIIDNRIYQKSECPKCYKFSPDFEWIKLDHCEVEGLWREQELNKYKDISKRLSNGVTVYKQKYHEVLLSLLWSGAEYLSDEHLTDAKIYVLDKLSSDKCEETWDRMLSEINEELEERA